MVYIKRSGTDKRVRDERIARERMRRQEDIHKGLTRSSEAQRGDYSFCKQMDKKLGEYARFKDSGDREKIKSEYFGLQSEARDKARIHK